MFDNIHVYISGKTVEENISVEQLQEIVSEFGANILRSVPNLDNWSSEVIPYHCQNNINMRHVTTIILYCKDSKRLMKYNNKYVKTFPISWFLETVQKFNID